MVRIRYENPLGTLAEGLHGGLDAAQKMQRLTKIEEQFDDESNETKAAQEFMAGLTSLTPDQRKAASGMSSNMAPSMMRFDVMQREQQMLEQERAQLQIEANDAMMDDELGLPPEAVKQILAQYNNDPTKGREALHELRADTRHNIRQIAMRRHANEKALNLMAANPTLFQEPPTGLSRTAEQEFAKRQLDELERMPARRGQPGPDYLGAAAVLEVLGTPHLLPAYQHILRQAQEDFEAWAQAMGQEQGGAQPGGAPTPPMGGPAGAQGAVRPNGPTGLGPQGAPKERKPGMTAAQGGRVVGGASPKGQRILAEEAKIAQEKSAKSAKSPTGKSDAGIFALPNVVDGPPEEDPQRLAMEKKFAKEEQASAAFKRVPAPSWAGKPEKNKNAIALSFSGDMESMLSAGEVEYKGKKYKVVGGASNQDSPESGQESILWVVPMK